jgi:uncharacterized protein
VPRGHDPANLASAAQQDSRRSHHDRLHGFYDAELRYVAAGGAGSGADFAEMAAHLHPDVTVHQGAAVPYAGEWRGVDAIERFFALYSRTWSTLDLSETRIFESDAGVATSLRMRATAQASRQRVDTRICQIVTFERTLIRRMAVFYLDPAQVQAATAG